MACFLSHRLKKEFGFGLRSSSHTKKTFLLTKVSLLKWLSLLSRQILPQVSSHFGWEKIFRLPNKSLEKYKFDGDSLAELPNLKVSLNFCCASPIRQKCPLTELIEKLLYHEDNVKKVPHQSMILTFIPISSSSYFFEFLERI